MGGAKEGGVGEAPGIGSDPRLTERRNPRTTEIDRASPREIVRMIQREDRRVPEAVEAEGEAIAELVERVAERLRGGGRLFYVGAGTSGRLGVLDAAECPPTFGTDPARVQGIIAGGPEALVRSLEGAEDDEEAAREAVRSAGIGPADFVLGIASSATTPFVAAAVEAAAGAGAGTGFLSCTPPPRRVRAAAEVLVTPLVGPEVIAGSTRMKAGTATKLVLNTVTTGAMIRLGKVHGNLMVDLRAVSRKLVGRSLRIVMEVVGVGPEEARRLLVAAGGSAKTAVAMGRLGADRAMAERLLDACDGFLGDVLERFGGAAELPYYGGYPPAPASGDASALLESLAAGPARVRDACRERAGAGEGDGTPGASVPAPHPWPPAAHLAHLLEFEEEAVTARTRRWLEEAAPELPDWPPSDPPPGEGRDPEALARAFSAARSRTLAPLREAREEGRLAEALGRRGRLAGRTVTLHQFLRGVGHHDRAHALRISERIHPALLDPDAAGATLRPIPGAGEE